IVPRKPEHLVHAAGKKFAAHVRDRGRLGGRMIEDPHLTAADRHRQASIRQHREPARLALEIRRQLIGQDAVVILLRLRERRRRHAERTNEEKKTGYHDSVSRVSLPPRLIEWRKVWPFASGSSLSSTSTPASE